MKWAGVFFGLNYKHIPSASLNGCVNDTILLSNMFKELLGPGEVDLYHDNKDLINTSYDGIIRVIFNLSIKAIKEKLDLVVIHYSGHGSQVVDTSGDELDGKDEVICPSDFPTRGMLKDDIIGYLLCGFPSYTRVVTVFDSCHSGTVTDIPLRWNGQTMIRENNNNILAKIISISGCMDSQTSGDTIVGGLLTTSLVRILQADKKLINNVFDLVLRLNAKLSALGARQRSVLCSSYDLRPDPAFLHLH